MKRINLIIIVSFIVSNILLSQTGKSIAVPTFEGGSGQDGETLADLFGSRLANKNVFTVLTRTSIEPIMKEHNFQRGGLTDIASAKALGKLFNADYIIVGKIRTLGKVNLLTVQMVNVQTGEVISGGDTTFENISETLYYIDTVIELIVRSGKSSNTASLDEAIAKQAGRNGIYDIKELIAIGLNAQNGNGETALILASKNEYTEIVKALINSEADVNIKDNNNGMTALMWASGYGYTEIVKALIAAGADVNIKDNNNGFTALIFASTFGYTEIVKALITAGADVNAKDNNNGYMALDLAIEEGHTEIVRLLKAAGAK